MKINWDTRQKQMNVYGMKIILKKVKLSDIHTHFDESAFTTQSITKLKNAMIRGEVIPPILLEKRRNGGYMIFDGNHRYYAAKKVLSDKGYIQAWVA